MIKECKKCGSKNLYLEPRVKGQNVLTANMVALKCKDCGIWLKWCPKEDRLYYLNKQQKDKWQKLKEWLQKQIKIERHSSFIACEKFVLEKMNDLESAEATGYTNQIKGENRNEK